MRCDFRRKMKSRALELLEGSGCGAVVSVPRERWPLGDETADLRLREEGVSPFGTLENFEKIAGSPIAVRPGLETVRPAAPLADLETLLSIRKKGHRVLCVPGDDAADAPRFSAETLAAARLELAARYFPKAFAALLADPKTAAGLKARGEGAALDLFCDFTRSTEADLLAEHLPPAAACLARLFGERAANRIFARLELRLGVRGKPSLGIYDHALQMAGGGQKYACTIAAALQDEYDVTFIANKPVEVRQLEEWYGLDLSRCAMRVVPLPFYEKKKAQFIDQGMAKHSAENPFAPVSEESKLYDVFMNVNMLTILEPQAPASVFLCHFPDSKKGRHFAVDRYDYVVANSLYTIEWLKKRWGLSPSVHIYPPVDMPSAPAPKEKLVLSVARFEASGSKKQLELLEAFRRLRENPGMAGWKLVLAGGSFGRNFYHKKVVKRAMGMAGVEVRANLPLAELKDLYARASIFWHACGLGEKAPERVEHFGMATVEAMQNGCIPVVINKGGQKEIVEAGVSGFLFDDLKGLCETTLKLAADPALRDRISEGARARSRRFTGKRFTEEVRRFFDEIRVKESVAA